MMNDRRQYVRRRNEGVALLTVLMLIMAITILSLGFVSRSDTELACGQNMTVRMQMDHLAQSGLEHARGLILNPQDLTDPYWTGGTALQLDTSSRDFYDVAVALDPNDHCNYTIQCEAYRLNDGEQTGLSKLWARLRLDPCIALWTDTAATLPNSLVVRGDVYCGGNLVNEGTIDGDTFSDAISGGGVVAGSNQDRASLSLAWPAVDVSYAHADYPTMSVGPGLVNGPVILTNIRRCSGNLALGSNVTIKGMLLVEGDLTIRGNRNRILAEKNLPALYVAGDLYIDDITSLVIEGLAVVEGNVWIGAQASDIDISGSLFLRTAPSQIAPDSSGSSHDCLMYGQPTWQPTGGQDGGALEFDGADDMLEDPLAGAYLNGLPAVTISLWVKSDVTVKDRGLIYVQTPDGSDKYLGLRYDQRGIFGGAWSCIKASVGTTAGWTQIESSAYVQTTNWQHLALVWEDGRSLRLYIDGVLNMPSYNKGPMFGVTAGAAKLTLGSGAYGRFWEGLIDDVRIYNRALVGGEIAQLYSNPSAGTTVGLLAHYRFDEKGPEVTVTANPAAAAIQTDSKERWSPAANAVFTAIER